MQDFKLTKSRIWMVLVIVIVSGISAALLTFVNLGTKERIDRIKEIKLKRSVLNVFDIMYKREDIISTFNERIKVREIKEKTFYEYYDKGRVSGIAFEIKGSGFWGPIASLVALEPNLDIIKGIEILHQEETPGLGARITEDEFKNQFRGRPVEPEIVVDAITGATMTSKAFKKIVNENVKVFREEFKKR